MRHLMLALAAALMVACGAPVSDTPDAAVTPPVVDSATPPTDTSSTSDETVNPPVDVPASSDTAPVVPDVAPPTSPCEEPTCGPQDVNLNTGFTTTVRDPGCRMTPEGITFPLVSLIGLHGLAVCNSQMSLCTGTVTVHTTDELGHDINVPAAFQSIRELSGSTCSPCAVLSLTAMSDGRVLASGRACPL